MNPNRIIPKNIVIQLNEHCTEDTIQESINLIYQCYVKECIKKGLIYCEPIVDGFGQQHVPHQFKQALHKYLWVNNLYLSPLSEVKNTYIKIMNHV